MFSILYVDDEPMLLELARLFLEKTGDFCVDTVTSATEALDILSKTSYDCIISDYQMPAMDGIVFLKTFRSKGNVEPFIIFTGKGREEVVIEALNNGADFYLQKGGDPKSQFVELAHKVRQAIQIRIAQKTMQDLVQGAPIPAIAWFSGTRHLKNTAVLQHQTSWEQRITGRHSTPRNARAWQTYS
jgi:CheY-like chemotaxis protein